MFQELGRDRLPQDPHTYIYAIARNILARHRRRNRAERAVLDEYARRTMAGDGRPAAPPADMGRSEEAGATEAQRILMAVVAKLPSKDAELVTLRFTEGLSVKQVAERMHCSENAASKRLQKLRPILRGLCQE